MTKDEIINEITEIRDNAVKRLKQLKDADTDAEFDELHYYNGQMVALNQVLSWLGKLTITNDDREYKAGPSGLNSIDY